jgi:hypothetical protein
MPHNIEPDTIHKNITDPNAALIKVPNIGPVPAIFKSCTKNAFHHFIGTQSTPSLITIAGVCLSLCAKIFPLPCHKQDSRQSALQKK